MRKDRVEVPRIVAYGVDPRVKRAARTLMRIGLGLLVFAVLLFGVAAAEQVERIERAEQKTHQVNP